MNIRRALAGGSCAALLAGAALLWRSGAEPEAAAVERLVRDDRGAASDAARESESLRARGRRHGPGALRHSIAPAVAPASRDAKPSEPLPPRDARIVDVFDELDRRAERGDVSAACRLGFDLTLCREREELRAGVRFFIDSGARYPQGLDGTVEIVQALEASLAHANRICDGLPIEFEANSWRHLARAGNLGDARAAARFAGLPQIRLFEAGTDVAIRRYHADHGARLLRQAFDAGDPAALYLIQKQYAGHAPPFDGARAVEPDPVLAIAYAMVLRSLSGVNDEPWYAQQIETARVSMSAQDFARAAAIGRAYLDRYTWPTERIDFAGGIFNGYHDSSHCEPSAARRG